MILHNKKDKTHKTDRAAYHNKKEKANFVFFNIFHSNSKRSSLSPTLNSPPKKVTTVEKIIRYGFLAVAVIFYSVFSLPAPKVFQLPELITALSLTCFVLIPFLFRPFRQLLPNGLTWQTILLLVFFYLLIIPLAFGLIYHNSLFDIARDIIPLFYLFLPLLCFKTFQPDTRFWQKGIIILLIFSAVSMTIRYWLYPETHFSDFGKEYLPFGTGLFVMEPGTIFTSTFLLSFSLLLPKYFKNKYLHYFLAICCFAGGLFVFSLPIATILRAQIILVSFAFFASVVYRLFFINKKRRWIVVGITAIILGSVIVFLFNDIVYYIKTLELKFEYVGWNLKDEEALQVITEVSSNPKYFLFGKGWGSTFLNPATYDRLYTRYTHNVFTYFLLKAGLMGVLLIGTYSVWILRYLWFILKEKQLFLFFAITNTLAIHFLLEGGYKQLSIGLILCLLLTTQKDSNKNITMNGKNKKTG